MPQVTEISPEMAKVNNFAKDLNNKITIKTQTEFEKSIVELVKFTWENAYEKGFFEGLAEGIDKGYEEAQVS